MSLAPGDLVLLRHPAPGYDRGQLVVYAAGHAGRVSDEPRRAGQLVRVIVSAGVALAPAGELELLERCQLPVFED